MRVVVVGAGIIGAACARSLARAGAEVVVLERSSTAGGTTGRGEGNLLVSDKAPGPELRLAQRSLRLWAQQVDDLREELGPQFPDLEYQRKGGLVVALTEPGLAALQRFADLQRAAGVDARFLTPGAARDREPELTPRASGAVHYPEDAQLQPVAAAEALLASARRAGAAVRTGVEVTGLDLHRDGSVAAVRTAGGPVSGDAVVLAAGPWSGVLAARMGLALPVRPRRGVVLVTTRLPPRIRHKVYDGDYVGAVASGSPDLQTSSVVESTAAGTVLIGSSREQVGFDEALRVRVLSELARKAITLFPFLAGAGVMRCYGGFRPYLPDHLPVIGPDPSRPGLWHATGHEGAGIGLAPATAELVSAGLLGLHSPGRADLPAFTVDRPALAGVVR